LTRGKIWLVKFKSGGLMTWCDFGLIL